MNLLLLRSNQNNYIRVQKRQCVEVPDLIEFVADEKTDL